MQWVNRIIALCLIGTCLVLWPMSARFPGSAADFPRLVLIIIAVLSAIMFVRTLVPTLVPVGVTEGEPGFKPLLRPLAAFAATVLAVFTIQYAGFFLAMAGLGLSLMIILGARRPVTFIGTYVGLMLFLLVVFQLLLNVPLTSTKLWGG